MTEKEKMTTGLMADTSDPEIAASYEKTLRTTNQLNRLTHHMPGYREVVQKLIPGIPRSSVIATPFNCDHGNITLGENCFINCGCVFLDGGGIRIGDNTLIGPAVQIYTPVHPTNYIERRKTIEKSLEVKIGNDCWIGGGVVICPGVTIGDRCIVGAGSVVVKDVPDDSFVAGNPAVIKRKLE